MAGLSSASRLNIPDLRVNSFRIRLLLEPVRFEIYLGALLGYLQPVFPVDFCELRKTYYVFRCACLLYYQVVS